MHLKKLHRTELPREKLQKYGPQKLATHELLAILLGSGIKGVNVLELAKQIEKKIGLVGVKKISLEDLLTIKGLGNAKATQVLAVIALSERLQSEQNPEVLSAKDVWNLCADFRASKKEHVAAFYLDTQNRLIERQIITIGTLDSSLLQPREVFEPAIRLSAASVILAHNHPSGELAPSYEDIKITEQMKKAGELLGVQISDHLVISSTSYRSLVYST